MQVARGRSFESGKTAFAAAQCILCHRIGEGRDAVGGVIGPDLTSIASRFPRRDIAESIINPSKIIDDKYRNTLFTTTDSGTILGTIELEDARKVVILTGPLSDQVIEVPKLRIQKREPSNI